MVSYVGAGFKPAPTTKRTYLPEGWVWKIIGDVCDILSGYGFPKNLQGKAFGDLPFYKVGVISQAWLSGNRYLVNANNYLSREEANKIKAKPLPAGTTVMAKIGEAIKLNRRALLAKPSLVDNNVMGIYPKPYYVDSRYNFYYLLTISLGNYSQATTVPSVRKSNVSEIPFPLAPLNEQKRIVAEIEKQFSRLDEAVAALKRIQANLKRYKASVLKAAVEGKLTEEWRSRWGEQPFAPTKDKTGADLLKRILVERRKKWEEDYVKKHVGAHGHTPKDDSWKKKYKEPAHPTTTNLPELPEGWVWATIEQLLDDALIGLDRGRSQQSDKPGGTPYIKMNNITMDGKVIFDDLVYVKTTLEDIFRFNVKDGDLLFNTRNSKELVGKVGLVKNLHVEAIYNNNLMRIRMPNSAKSNFICAQMCSLEFRRRMELVKKATTNVAAIYAKDLFPLPVALPPSYEQELIMAEVERLLSVADEIEIAIEFNLKRADRLRQSILKKAFSGKLV
jgi:type I restriction enzyme S subunit